MEQPNELASFSSLSLQPTLLSKVLEQLYKDTGLTEDSCFWDMENPQAYVHFRRCLCDYLADLNTNNKPKLMHFDPLK